MSYPYMQNQSQYYQQPNAIYKPSWAITTPTPQVRPVSSIEEVRASPIDFDGSVFYFPDIANKKIYTKFVNVDGTVAINLYELKDLTIANQSFDSSAYVTRQEFEAAIASLKQTQTEMTQPAAQQQQKDFQF